MEFKYFLLSFWIIGISAIKRSEAASAICVFKQMTGVDATIGGTAHFSQPDATGNLTVAVKNVHGLSVGKHGFHIHENGNCTNPGSHFNPQQMKHGFIYEPNREYHVGDFGNLDVKENNLNTEYTVSADIAGLFKESKHQIIGKSFVMHAGEDDLGKGGDVESTKTGNAGTKLACCVIAENAAHRIGALKNPLFLGLLLLNFSHLYYFFGTKM